jgi:hypothetical protein
VIRLVGLVVLAVVASAALLGVIAYLMLRGRRRREAPRDNLGSYFRSASDRLPVQRITETCEPLSPIQAAQFDEARREAFRSVRAAQSLAEARLDDRERKASIDRLLAVLPAEACTGEDW